MVISEHRHRCTITYHTTTLETYEDDDDCNTDENGNNDDDDDDDEEGGEDDCMHFIINETKRDENSLHAQHSIIIMQTCKKYAFNLLTNQIN